jgi:hypothetical protein
MMSAMRCLLGAKPGGGERGTAAHERKPTVLNKSVDSTDLHKTEPQVRNHAYLLRKLQFVTADLYAIATESSGSSPSVCLTPKLMPHEPPPCQQRAVPGAALVRRRPAIDLRAASRDGRRVRTISRPRFDEQP